jgi:hypothetical protein
MLEKTTSENFYQKRPPANVARAANAKTPPCRQCQTRHVAVHVHVAHAGGF